MKWKVTMKMPTVNHWPLHATCTCKEGGAGNCCILHLCYVSGARACMLHGFIQLSPGLSPWSACLTFSSNMSLSQSYCLQVTSSGTETENFLHNLEIWAPNALIPVDRILWYYPNKRHIICFLPRSAMDLEHSLCQSTWYTWQHVGAFLRQGAVKFECKTLNVLVCTECSPALKSYLHPYKTLCKSQFWLCVWWSLSTFSLRMRSVIFLIHFCMFLGSRY